MAFASKKHFLVGSGNGRRPICKSIPPSCLVHYLRCIAYTVLDRWMVHRTKLSSFLKKKKKHKTMSSEEPQNKKKKKSALLSYHTPINNRIPVKYLQKCDFALATTTQSEHGPDADPRRVRRVEQADAHPGNSAARGEPQLELFEDGSKPGLNRSLRPLSCKTFSVSLVNRNTLRR